MRNDRSTALPLIGWSGLMVLFLATGCVESLSWSQMAAFTPMFLRQIGVPASSVPNWTAASASVNWLIALPLAPFWGVLADRYSRKAVIVRSAVVEAVIFAGWALATDPWVALGFRCLSGFVLGNTGVMLAVQVSATPLERLGIATGFVAAGGPAGRAVGPILGAGLINLFGIRGMLLADAAASVVIAVLLLVLLRDDAGDRIVGEGPIRMLRTAAAEIASSPLLRRLFLAVFAAQLATGLLLPFLPIVIARRPAGAFTGALAVGAVLSAMAAAQAVASPLWGRAVDRVGHRGLLAATSTGAAAALLAAALTSSLPALGLALVAYGALVAAVITSNMTALAQNVRPERRASVLGLVLMPLYVSGLIGPPVGALLFPAGERPLFGVAAVLAFVPVLFVATIRVPGAGARPRAA